MDAIIWTDGGSRGNPGPSAFGVVILPHDGEIYFEKHYIYGPIGKKTNNVAEYFALAMALKFCKKSGYRKIFAYSDSELMVKQIKGEYICRSDELKAIYDEIIKELGHFEAFHIQHIPREENTEADSLVNKALDGLTR